MLPKTFQQGKCLFYYSFFFTKKIFLFLIVPPLLCFLLNIFINNCKNLKEIQRALVLIHKILLYFTPNDSSAVPLRQHTVCLLLSFCLMPALHSYTVALEKSRDRHLSESSLGKIPVMMRIVVLQQKHTQKSNLYNVHPVGFQPVSDDREGDAITVVS